MNDLVTVGNLLEIADLGSTGFAVNVSVKVCQMSIISKASYRLRWQVISSFKLTCYQIFKFFTCTYTKKIKIAFFVHLDFSEIINLIHSWVFLPKSDQNKAKFALNFNHKRQRRTSTKNMLRMTNKSYYI